MEIFSEQFVVQYPGVEVNCVAYVDLSGSTKLRLNDIYARAQAALAAGKMSEATAWTEMLSAHLDVTPQTPFTQILKDHRLCPRGDLYRIAHLREAEERWRLKAKSDAALSRRSLTILPVFLLCAMMSAVTLRTWGLP
jgi:hypothetical protein